MAVSGQAGPLVVYGQNPATLSYQPDYNPDTGPSGFAGGIMLLDPRYGYRTGLQAFTLQAFGMLQTVNILAIDEVPATAAAAAIAASQAAVAGTAMTLVAVSGAGVVVSTAPYTYPASGVTANAGTRFINSQSATLFFGNSTSIGVADPRTMIARAVSITSSSTAATFTVRGLDVWGFPLTEVIAAGGATTTAGKKAFKAILSITPSGSPGGTYTVGTTDIFGLPYQVLTWGALEITMNNATVTAVTGWLTADTATATGTTGDVRGTYTVQSSSDGSKRLQIAIAIPAQSIGQVNGALSQFGQIQFAG